MNITALGQRDPRWRGIPLGFSKTETIGSAGCLTTCFAMMAATTPDVMNTCRKQHGGYVAGSGLAANFDIKACAPGVRLAHQSQRWDRIPVPAAELARLIAHLRSGQVAIVEVDSNLTLSGQQQHFVLATGIADDPNGGEPVIRVNDPWPGDVANLLPRYGSGNARAIYRYLLYEVTELQVPPAEAGDYETISALNMRATMPDVSGALGYKLGTLPAGARLKIVRRDEDGSGQAWGLVALTQVNGIKLATPGWFYVHMAYVRRVADEVPPTLPPPSPPPTNTLPAITVNVLGGGQRANEARALGAKWIDVTFNPGHARRLLQESPGLMVIVRPDDRSGQLDAWKAKVELDSLLPGSVVLGINENDGQDIGSDTPKHVLDRAHFDERAWGECKKRGLTYAGMSFAVASVDMTNPAMVKAIRDWYAPLFNGGMWANMHCYMARDGSGQNGQPGVPLMERFTRAYTATMHGKTFTMRQSWWTAEWWRWLFLFCGFDPRKSKVIADEMGLEGTIEMRLRDGGFNENPEVDMIGYLRAWQYYTGLPVLYGEDMQEYPSPFLCGAVYCAGEKPGGRWWGYEIGHRLNEIAAAFWQG